MKKYCIAGILILLFEGATAQRLTQVSFLQAESFSWFTITTNQNILIRIADNGIILEYGTEQASLYNRNYFSPKLLPYPGAAGFYQNEPDSALNGKIKNIGSCFFTYYSSKDYPEKAGKLKTAGNLLFDYYRQYDDALLAGKIKNIGTNVISYYSSFEDAILKGRLKSVGSTAIAYYASFDNPSFKGKLKSIGSFHLDWATSATSNGFVSYLKTGTQRPIINVIIYILQ